MSKNSIKIDGVSFSKAFLQSHKSEAELMEAMNSKTYAHIWEGDPERESKIKNLYAQVQPKAETVSAEVAETANMLEAEAKKDNNKKK